MWLVEAGEAHACFDFFKALAFNTFHQSWSTPTKRRANQVSKGSEWRAAQRYQPQAWHFILHGCPLQELKHVKLIVESSEATLSAASIQSCVVSHNYYIPQLSHTAQNWWPSCHHMHSPNKSEEGVQNSNDLSVVAEAWQILHLDMDTEKLFNKHPRTHNNIKSWGASSMGLWWTCGSTCFYNLMFWVLSLWDYGEKL